MRMTGLSFVFLLSTILPAFPAPGIPFEPDPSIRAWYLSPEEVAGKAHLVVRGNIEGVRTEYESGHVFTHYTLRITERWKGAWDSPTIDVRQIGGTHGDSTTAGSPPLRAAVGDSWVFALVRLHDGAWTVLGLTQGGFRVRNDTVERDFVGYRFIAPPPVTLHDNRETLSVESFRRRVQDGLLEAPEPAPRRGPKPIEAPDPGLPALPPSDLKDSPSRPPPPSDQPPRRDEDRSEAPNPAAIPAQPAKPHGTAPVGLPLSVAVIVLAATVAAWRCCRRKGVRRSIVAVLVLLAASLCALAYVRSYWEPDENPGGISWNLSAQTPAGCFLNGKVKYRFDTTGDYAIPDNLRWAIVNAFQTWEDSPTAVVQLVRGEDITASPWDADFAVGFSDASESCPRGSVAGAAGVTWYGWTGSYLNNADIYFNRTVSWTTDGSSFSDMEAVALHEIGHAVVLIQSELDNPSAA